MKKTLLFPHVNEKLCIDLRRKHILDGCKTEPKMGYKIVFHGLKNYIPHPSYQVWIFSHRLFAESDFFQPLLPQFKMEYERANWRHNLEKSEEHNDNLKYSLSVPKIWNQVWKPVLKPKSEIKRTHQSEIFSDLYIILK